MSEEEHSPEITNVPLSDLKMEPGAEDLLDSRAMEPYIRLAIALETQEDLQGAVAEIAALPLEQRYVWRVASALKWAFADFDTICVAADRKTISDDDRKQLIALIKHRPLQFCLFLGALVGQKQMELLMLSAIKESRMVAKMSEVLHEGLRETEGPNNNGGR